MGLLAGAVMGLGKGMMINAEADRQAEAKDLDFMREQKLAELRGQIEGGLQKERMTFEGGEKAQDRSAAKLLQESELTHREKLTKEELASREREGEADRRNRRDVANIGAAADRYSADRKTSAKKWTIKVATRKESKTVPGQGIVQTDTPQYSATGPDGVTYIQLGDAFVHAGSDLTNFKKPTRWKEAEAALRKHGGIERFARDLGYVPAWYIAQNSSGTEDGDSTDD